MGIIKDLVIESIITAVGGTVTRKMHIDKNVEHISNKIKSKKKEAIDNEIKRVESRSQHVLSAYLIEKKREYGLGCKYPVYTYSIVDAEGVEQYQAVLENFRCDIFCVNDKNRKMYIKSTRHGYAMYDNVMLGNVIFPSYNKGILKRTTREYKYDYNGWILKESYMPHEVEVYDSFFLGQMASIRYKGDGFVIGYNNQALHAQFLMSALIPLITLSAPEYNENG